jgi:hypothetical protein
MFSVTGQEGAERLQPTHVICNYDPGHGGPKLKTRATSIVGLLVLLGKEGKKWGRLTHHDHNGLCAGFESSSINQVVDDTFNLIDQLALSSAQAADPRFRVHVAEVNDHHL